MKNNRSNIGIPWFIVYVFIIAVIGILTTGLIFFAKQKERVKNDAVNNLTAIANLKVKQIVQWRKERINGAQIIFNNTSLINQIDRFLKLPQNEEIKKEVSKLLETIRLNSECKSVLLLDPNTNIKLSSPPQIEPLGLPAEAISKKAIQARKPIFSDIHLSEQVSYIHLDLIIPLFLPYSDTSRNVAQLLLRIDPNITLFPLIQTWPTPSPTSETILIKQEGDSIVYLNELRHLKNSALKLRFPLTEEHLPAAMAIRGFEGITEGIDYRKVPVLSVIRKIPNSEWYIISKTDLKEVYAPFNMQGWIAGGGILLLIIAVASITGLWIRHQQARFYRSQYLDELERQALLKHIDYAIKYANDAILLLNKEGKVIEANDRACEIYQYTKQELLQLNIRDLRSPDTLSLVGEQMKKVADLGGLVFETKHMRKDGSIIPVEVSSRTIEIENKIFYQSIIRDISERKKAERSLRESEYKLALHIEETPLAFIESDTNFNIIKWNPAAEKIFGYSAKEVIGKHLDIIVPESFREQAKKIMKALLEQKGGDRSTNENVTKDGRTIICEWYNTPLINEEGKVIGIASMAQDITEQKQREKEIQIANERLHYLLSSTSAVIYTLKAQERYDFTFVSANSKFLCGFEPEDFLSNPHFWIDHIHPDDAMRVLEELPQIFERESYIQEYRFQHKNGSYIWLRDEKKAVLDKEGKPAEILGLWLDITEQKKAEESLIQSEETAHALLNAPKEVAYLLDLERKIITINEAGASAFHKTQNELIGVKIDELLPNEIAESRVEIFEKIIRTPQIQHFQDQYFGKYWENSFYPIYNIHGMVNQIAVYSRDITEKRKAEETLRNMNETLNTIFESAPLPIFMLDLQANIQNVWNPAAEKLLGWTKEEVIGKRLPYIQPEKEEEFKELFNHLMAGESLNGVEVVRQKKDGTKIEFAIYANPLHDNSGKITGFIVMLTDLTERRKAEILLRQSEQLFKSLVETSPIAIAVYSGASKIIAYTNSNFKALFGYSEEDIKDIEGWWNIAYPAEEYREKIKSRWLDISEREYTNLDNIATIESVITCKDGSTKYVDTSYSTIGEQSYMFFIDLTQYRIAEEALRQSHHFNELLIQTIPYGIDIVDEEGKILFMSKAMKTLVGFDATGSYCWEVYRDNKNKCEGCPIEKSISFSKPETLEINNLLGGRIYQISQIGMLYEGRKAILEIFQDITEQKRMQQEIMQSQKLLSIGTMAGGIAHDFNNVLAIILGYSSILLSIKDDNQKFVDGVNAIRNAVDRGASLVRQILTFARKTDTSFQPLSIPDVIKELVSMLQQTFPKIITFNTVIEKHIPYINADHTQIHQALLNLCVNARDAMPDGGEITMKVETIEKDKLRERFPSAANKYYLYIGVSDNGIGMDENVKNQIFDPFFTTKEKGRGTGLGLSVVYGIMQAHQGFVDVESELGKGTTFKLYFPIPQESSIMMEAQKEHEEVIAGGTETILVVEDESLLRELLQILLESNGYKVFTAKDGEEAVEIYSKHVNEIELVVSDYGLPKLTGSAVYEKLKQVNPSVKIIFASGYFEPHTRMELEKEGAKGFLQKPYVTDDVLSKVRKVLDEK